MHFLTDRYLLLPFVERTTWLYTKLGITPNQITLFNNIIVTPLLLYCLFNRHYLPAFALLVIRLILDGSDGYIARTYKLSSLEGEVYDHVGDSMFVGFIFMIILHRLNVPLSVNAPAVYITTLGALLMNFDPKWKDLSTTLVGVGGVYDAYCTLCYLLIFGVMYFLK